MMFYLYFDLFILRNVMSFHQEFNRMPTLKNIIACLVEKNIVLTPV